MISYINPLASSDQINISPSWKHGINKEDEFKLRFLANNLIQTVGVYLHLDQLIISRAIVFVQRFYCTSSLKDHSIVNISTASLLLSSKLVSGIPIKPGQLCYIVNFLLLNQHLLIPRKSQLEEENLAIAFNNEVIFDTYERLKEISMSEMELLAGISFDTQLHLPYSLALSYIQVLSLNKRKNGNEIVKTTWSIINDGIINSPYLTIIHQPNTIAVTSIIIATTNLNIIVSDQQDWWDLFDVNSEDIGHSMALILEGISYSKYIDRNCIRLNI